ncbi:DUF4595 domain-containing protein [Parabacteroides gordonii]|uniref:Uncharacterized protein n=1 Tax=Parabacteroides gordonii MS-1 = DSM 23371 TaxID=1203610 RepID=A0A0F5JDG8_9BACT|nr:DUF4595 domain-containing protein [Parabacteroides gordonii]KKB55530.1 hypothetical protein HMPREF1536_03001 [Parabacteroides gordonii MS-1 = DSM 23371]MCA5581680.1 DUF4595 domain-containing protein [Parabacteroides gordonii]RGP18069.1 DUF4595 domain-containing protein [Parabacteroides gordonii]
MKTYRLYSAVLMMALCFNFISCSDDDDNGGTDPEKAVKRLTTINYQDNSGKGSLDIERLDGKVSKTTETYKRVGYEMSWTSNYTYTGNAVKESLDIKNTDEGNFTKTTNYTLNNDGFIVKGEETDSGIWSFIYSGNYLTSATLVYKGKTDVDDKYIFNGEGLMTGNNVFDKGITYTDIPNLGGIFLAYADDVLATEYSRLQYASLLGNAPKYLPKEAKRSNENEIYTFNYEIDKDGYVTKAIIYLNGEVDWTETYTYEEVR